jgi:hypothetical protein
MNDGGATGGVGSATTPEERFADIVFTLFGEPGVTPPTAGPEAGHRFGSHGLKVNGKIFAMLVRGIYIVKLPRPRVDALCASGDGRRWDPGHGRLMKEWLALDPTSREDWLTLAKEALAFVGEKA